MAQTTLLLRGLLAMTGVNIALTSYTLYSNDLKLERNLEESEARMDEIEGTLRGHIGLIEDSLKRLEDRAEGKKVQGGWGQGMSEASEKMYGERSRDEKKGK